MHGRSGLHELLRTFADQQEPTGRLIRLLRRLRNADKEQVQSRCESVAVNHFQTTLLSLAVGTPTVRKPVAFDFCVYDSSSVLDKEVRTEPKNSTKKNDAS